jgi:RES domain-containing protein
MPIVYRIAKKRHPVYDGTGAYLVGGRWTSPGRMAIYAAWHYSTALVEVLVHAGRLSLPGPHHAAAIHIPEDLPRQRFIPTAHPGWEADDLSVARAYGDGWFDGGHTAVLEVPSVPGAPIEWNVIVSPNHPDAARIQAHPEFDVTWDGRLFGPPHGSVPTP